MQTVEHIQKSNVSPKAVQAKGETKVKVPSENLKLSSETVVFRNNKAGCQPCLSFMPAVQNNVQRCEDSRTTSKQETSADRMRDSVRRFRESLMYSVPGAIREQAVDTLNLLIRFDKSISLEESRILMDAVKIIAAKGLPA